jgi:flagellar hook assembly protein FlgD
VIAVIAGADLSDLQANSDLAQSLYDMDFVTHSVTVLSPNGDEELSGDVEITWTDSSAFGTSLKVDIAVSKDNGQTWEEIAQGIDDLGHFTWNTLDFPDGTRYKVRVTVYDTLAVGEDVSDTIFTVNNPGNGIPDMVLISPKKGQLRGEVEVNWWASDADHDTLSISIFVRREGEEWEVLADGLENTGTYTFNSQVLLNSYYWLKIRASDRDTFSEDSSGMLTVVNDHEPWGEVQHLQGGCNTLSLLPLLYFPDSVIGHTLKVSFNRIRKGSGSNPIYSCDIYDYRTGELLIDDFELSTELDGLLYVDFTPPIQGMIAAMATPIDGEGFAYVEFRDLVNESGFDGNLTLYNPDSFGVAHPIPGLKWAFRGSDYEIHWVRDSLDTTCVTLEVYDLTNQVFVPYDSVPGDNWFLGQFGDYDRCLDPTRHKCFYLSGALFYFNADGSMTVPPGPGDVWLIRSAGPKVPCEGNIYLIYPLQVRERNQQSRISIGHPLPNPARNRAILTFSLPKREKVRLDLYNVAGRRVNSVDLGYLEPGLHRFSIEAVDLRGKRLPSGLYFLKVKVGEKMRVEKIMFLR